MQRQCEICESLLTWGEFEPAPKPARTRGLLIEERVLAVCDEHAELIEAAGCTSLEQLRDLFPERTGHRSLVPRRAALDRRVFPPRPEGRRFPGGRRTTDAAE